METCIFEFAQYLKVHYVVLENKFKLKGNKQY